MRTTRLVLALAAVAASSIALAPSASAHVTVFGPGATQGGFAKITFRVPTEEDVPTTKLEITFPADAPLATVRTKPHIGWTATVAKGPAAQPFEVFGEKQTEQVTSLTLTAARGGGIKAGEFDEFEVSAGPLPKVDKMVFRVLQTYADGTVVRWIEEQVEGAAEPEKPAPVLALAPAADEGAAASPSAGTSVEAETVSASDDASDGAVFGGVALGVAGLALLISLYAAFRAGKGRHVT